EAIISQSHAEERPSFETAASRPPQDEEQRAWPSHSPHAEDRPKGAISKHEARIHHRADSPLWAMASFERQADIVLGQAAHRRIGAGEIVELRELAPAVERRFIRVTMEHGGHPPGEALDLPDPAEAASRISLERVGGARPVE